MAKPPKTAFVCQECGAQSPKWMGRCPDCSAWNAFVEERAAESGGAPPGGHRYAMAGAAAAARLYSDITIEQQAPAGEPACPICLARGTRLATPAGDVAIEDVRVGMHVWSIDQGGRRIVANVVRVGQTRVPASHLVVRLVLDEQRALRDRLPADLRPGPGTGLRVGVDHRHALARLRRGAGQMDRECGFAAATLLRDEGQGQHGRLHEVKRAYDSTLSYHHTMTLSR